MPNSAVMLGFFSTKFDVINPTWTAVPSPVDSKHGQKINIWKGMHMARLPFFFLFELFCARLLIMLAKILQR